MDTEEIKTETKQESVEEKPPHLTIIHCVGLLFLWMILQAWVALIIDKSAGSAIRDTIWLKIVLSNGLSGILTAQAGAILAGMPLALLLKREFPGFALIPTVISVVGLTIISAELGNLLQTFVPVSKAYIKIVNELFQQNVIGGLFTVAIVAPATEELIFRGVILEGLTVRYRLLTALVFSSLLFALSHGEPAAVINAFFLGFFFAWLKLETGSLQICMIAHGLYNSLPLLLTKLLRVEIIGYNTQLGETVQFQPVWFDLLGVALFILGIAGIRYWRESMEKEKPDPYAENAP